MKLDKFLLCIIVLFGLILSGGIHNMRVHDFRVRIINEAYDRQVPYLYKYLFKDKYSYDYMFCHPWIPLSYYEQEWNQVLTACESLCQTQNALFCYSKELGVIWYKDVC